MNYTSIASGLEKLEICGTTTTLKFAVDIDSSVDWPVKLEYVKY